ncbi:PQQ-binding-like beta-propeller repeat protein [Kitasatospora sp. NPDC097643]|uniref:protein kinase domain-containing protein n=1 Tax=Kitasatospora sp. NPDC097643 TaxID=3157230 RepID=UPI00332B2014
MEPLNSTDPEAVGPYRLIARLGAGGMGQVYLARSTGGRTVAVKVVRPELAQDAEFRARFRREVAAAQAVDGAYTAPVTDADPDAPAPWLATAYVLGPSLTDAVRDHGPLPEASVRALGTRLAEALEAIHRAGLVHRDLKPSNVLLAADGPRVIDFGIARAMDGDSMTQTGAVVGSPGFMSPEQASGRPTGAPGDVFSLASVLIYAATGHGPFDSASGIAAQLYKVVHEDADLGDVPPALRAVLEPCLRKDPALRPTPTELRARLATGAALGEWHPGPVAAVLARHAAAVMDLETPLRDGPPAPAAVPYTPTQVAGPASPAGPAGAFGPPLPSVPAPVTRFTPGLSRRRLLLSGGSLAAIAGVTWALTRPKDVPNGPTPGATPSATRTLRPAPKPVWTYTTGGVDPALRPALALGDQVYTDADQLTALDAATGSVVWQRKNSSIDVYSVAAGDLYCTEVTQMQRIAPADGSVSYSTAPDYPGGNKLHVETFVAATDQAVFAKVTIARNDYSGGNPGMMALRRGLAGQLWYQEDADVADLKAPGTVSGTTLLHLNNANAVVARNTADGKRLWKVETGSRADWPVWADDQRAYCAADGFGLQAVALTDGKPVWRIDPPEGGRVGALLVADGTLYLSAGNESFSAVDATTGKPHWTCALDRVPDFREPPVLIATTLFVAGQTGDNGTPCVHAIDTTTGRLKWTFTDPKYNEAERISETFHLSTNGKLAYAWLKHNLSALPTD